MELTQPKNESIIQFIRVLLYKFILLANYLQKRLNI